jgi:hypothetical protein
VRSAGDAKIFLHVRRQTSIDAEQDAAQQRGLRLRQNLLNDDVGAIAESIDGRENRAALIVCQHFDLRTIDHGIHALPRKEIIVIERGEFGRRSELACYMHPIAVTKFGRTRRTNENNPLDRARGSIGGGKSIGVDTQIDVGVAHIGRPGDHSSDRHDANPVVGGQRILIEVRQAHGKPKRTTDGEDDADPDQAGAMIISPEEETNDWNEKRGEQKFNQQVECRSERDSDEPASAEVDEWLRCTDPRLIILAQDRRQAGELSDLTVR